MNPSRAGFTTLTILLLGISLLPAGLLGQPRPSVGRGLHRSVPAGADHTLVTARLLLAPTSLPNLNRIFTIIRYAGRGRGNRPRQCCRAPVGCCLALAASNRRRRKW
jgi:hypothetical protein